MSATIYTNLSFILFIYPFLFEEADFEQHIQAISQAQWSIDKRDASESSRKRTIWQSKAFAKDDLLAEVAAYLSPDPSSAATARLWVLQPNDISRMIGSDTQTTWQLHLPGKSSIPFKLHDPGEVTAQLALFRPGVGFLTLRAKPDSPQPSDWLDFLHYFRFIQGQRGVKVQAQRRVGIDAVAAHPILKPFFPEPAGGLATHPEGLGEFGDIITALLQTGTLPRSVTPWWQEVFVPGLLLPYAVLFVDQTPAADLPELLYRVRRLFHATQPIHPTAADLHLEHPALLPYAKEQWFSFSLEGGAFLASNAPDDPFFRQTLPDHLRDQYYLLFLLAQNQRFTLMMLSQKVTQKWLLTSDPDNAAREHTFERIRDTLLSFTARGYFPQAMQRENHHRYYCKWQDALQLDRLYQQVSNEVREMHEYSQLQQSKCLQAQAQQLEKQTQKVEERLNLISAFFFVPTLIISFLNINLKGVTASEGLSFWPAFGFVLILTLLLSMPLLGWLSPKPKG